MAQGDSADKFAYHPVTGALSAAEDRYGNLFSFNHDDTGRLTGMTMPGGLTDTRWYDLEGRLLSRQETGVGGALLLSEAYTYDARDKLLLVTVPGTSTYAQWYSGLGNLVRTDWKNVGDPQFQREGFTADPLGNVVQKHVYGAGQDGPYDDHPDFRYHFDNHLGRVLQVSRLDTLNSPSDPSPHAIRRDDTFQRYDDAGNLETSFQGVIGPNTGDGSYTLQRRVDSRSYYGADDRLRAFQQYNDQPGLSQSTSTGLWEEYRYDPLGRRVAVRTLRPDGLCNQPDCFDTFTFFVWSGDQILWELRSTDAAASPDTRGQVSYFHAGGIDRPLTIWKQGVGTVVTHQSWRGQLARGTFGEGTGRVGQSTKCPEFPATNGCVPVAWPGWNTRAWNEEAAKPNTTGDERRVVPQPLDVLQPRPPAHHVVREVQHVVRLVVGQVHLQQLQPPVDLPRQPQPRHQPVHCGDAPVARRVGVPTDLVVHLPHSQHRLRPRRPMPRPRVAAGDPALAAGTVLSALGVRYSLHRKG